MIPADNKECIMNRTEKGYVQSAEFYDYIPLYSDRKDVEFYLDLARKTDGSILELGCGTGRVLIPLARAGYRITGIDSSKRMLEVCRDKLKEEASDTGERVTVIQGDMRDFDLKRCFDLIIVPFRAFQHLETVEEQLRCLEIVRRHMSEGGLFVLDLFNPSMKYILDETRKNWFGDESPFTLPDGRTVTRRFRNPSVDLSKQIIDLEIIYHSLYPDGRTEKIVDSFKMRYLFRYEAEHLLERAGFRVLEVLGDFDGSPFGTKWPGELILIAH